MSRVPRAPYQTEHGSESCRVIVSIREKTRQAVMSLLSAKGQGDNLSALVEDLLAQWLASQERPARKRNQAAATERE
jgi:hypothetical protein